ncbi:cellobiose transport system permease protein [Paenibacillus sp. V4I3]|jgi:cellobiose transport system permease protein|uniref:ABC transporter permease subunit n=1 Tax=Paenibacillus phytorum TaxID=2654977 RepID=A0ABX1XV90_9BACL|nr:MULTISPECIES: sugar ABC transporter permease [Paenibacillus]KRE46925.1 cytochrome C biogenesis protein [Paenibacillus sp. Soil724D2]MDQ0873630.1 cellobiose transport system permease protein [Paenibacillus sp. V4I3]MDQ0890440.1 cellobiose transport system permease protein [Paenibacillus sp. V4I9]NOU71723.1 ABC transporter permease subunit [Paenibacillus phytorum]
MRGLKTYLAPYLMISPFYILFIVFGLFPILFSLYLAFHSWDGLGPMEFVGLRNFRNLLTDDPDFWKSVGNTFVIWFFSTLPQLFLALVVAFLLNAAFVRFKDFYRAVYFLPNITSIVAVAIIFGSFFGSQFGLINGLLQVVGLPRIEWINDPFWVKVAVSLMVIWRWTGYNAIIYLAGLQSIPHDLYEAATIDGASRKQQFFSITLPLLKPIILFTVILSTIGGMQLFTEPLILVGNTGGATKGGLTLVLYLYNQAFGNQLFGYASAIAWMLFLIIGIFSFLNWKFVSRGEGI